MASSTKRLPSSNRPSAASPIPPRPTATWDFSSASRVIFVEALAELKRGHELGTKNPNWHYPSAEWVRETERLVELDRKLPAILGGQDKPADAAESLTLAQLCYDKKLHGASARLWAEAFQAQPKLAEDMQVPEPLQRRLRRGTGRLGPGQGRPTARRSEPKPAGGSRRLTGSRPTWRRGRRSWKAARHRHGQFVAQTLQHWKADTDLTGMRDAAALAKLPEDEQKACRALWAEVDALLAKSQGTNPKSGH